MTQFIVLAWRLWWPAIATGTALLILTCILSALMPKD